MDTSDVGGVDSENDDDNNRNFGSEERQPLTTRKSVGHAHIALSLSNGSDISDEESNVTEDVGDEASSTTNAPEGLKRRAKSSSSFHNRRPVLTVADKHEQYKYAKPLQPGFRRTLKEKFLKETSCSSPCFKDFVFLRFPILEWILHYKLKTDLVGDIIAGSTVAVMHIPQGMAYALLANLDPIVGIYMAFFPVFFYAIFASSRHCSMGTFAVICLMTGKLVAQYATFPDAVGNGMKSGNGTNGTGEITIYTPNEVATIVSFGVSIWMILFGFLNLGSLTVFLSDMLISGFTTGAAVQVATSQLKSLFGVNIETYSGTFQVILTWKAFFGDILESNPATMVISMICIIVLLINNELIKPRLKKKTRIPVPIELIVVVCGTLASKYGDLNGIYDVVIIGDIPTGLPPPTVPPFSLLGKVILPCLTITIVSFSVSFSMAKIFAMRNDYVVDATQELYATGIGNVVGSFFQCAPISASLSRSLIQESVGGATQLTSFISCGIIVLVLLFIGSFFETLPNCVLAAIIITALKGMFLQVYDFMKMWKISRVEASVWLISFLGVVIIDIDTGLFIGILASLLLLIYRSQTPVLTVLGKVENLEIYLDKDRYASVSEIPGLKLIHVAGSLHFANKESFRQILIKLSGVDPRVICETVAKERKKIEKEKVLKSPSPMQGFDQTVDMECDGTGASPEETIPNENQRDAIKARDLSPSSDISSKTSNDIENIILNIILPDARNIILDLSGVGQMDISGAKNLAQVYKEFATAHVSLHFTSLSENCSEMMETSGALEDIPQQCFFHSINDAVFRVTSNETQREQGVRRVSDVIDSKGS